jgi:hypothetical protein
MQEYKLQIKGKWQSFTVPQMAQAIYAAQHRMHLTAFGAFLAGGFVGGLLMLIVLVGLYGGR